jgi:hypothetical protein
MYELGKRKIDNPPPPTPPSDPNDDWLSDTGANISEDGTPWE